MRKFTGVLAGILLLCGCASHKGPAPKPAPSKSTVPKPVITPNFQPVGRVAKVNLDGRFVIISFPPGELPKAEDRLNVYRNGLKVAEVKVDQWQGDNNTVADIVAGEVVQVGDEVRQN